MGRKHHDALFSVGGKVRVQLYMLSLAAPVCWTVAGGTVIPSSNLYYPFLGSVSISPAETPGCAIRGTGHRAQLRISPFRAARRLLLHAYVDILLILIYTFK